MDIKKKSLEENPNESAFDHILRAIRAKEEEKKIVKVNEKDKIFHLKERETFELKTKVKEKGPGLKKSTKKNPKALPLFTAKSA